MEWLILIGGAASAIIAIYKVVKACCNAINSFIKFLEELKADVNTLVEHDKDQYLSILRLTVINSDMPMSERLIAGKKYIDKGGNGDVKHLYENLEGQCNNQQE